MSQITAVTELDAAAYSSFTQGLAFSSSDVAIIVAALRDMTDYHEEEIAAFVSEFWKTHQDLHQRTSFSPSVTYAVRELIDRLEHETPVSLSGDDLRLIAPALRELSIRTPADVETTYRELAQRGNPTIDQILADEGELHRYAALLQTAVTKFVTSMPIPTIAI